MTAPTDPPGLDAAAEAIRDRLDDLGVEGHDEEGTLDGSLWLDGLESVAEDLARAAAPALRAGALRGLADVLAKHYLAEVVCDHERSADNPRCACSLVHLGWYPSVGQAVDGWIEHVLTELRERADRIGGAT